MSKIPQIARTSETEASSMPGLTHHYESVTRVPPAPHNHKQLFIISDQAFRSLQNEEVEAIVKDMEELGIYKLPYPSVSIRVSFDVSTSYQPKGAVGTAEVTRELIKTGKLVWNEAEQKYNSNFGPGAWIDIENIQLDHLELAREYITVDHTNAAFKPFRSVMWHSEQGMRLFNREGLPAGTPLSDIDQQLNIASTALMFAKALIVLLATRNVVKSTKHNTLAKHGFGVKKDSSRRFEYVTTITTPTEMPESDEERPPSGREVCAHLRRGHIRRQHFGPNNSFIKRIWIEPVFVNADKDWVNTRKAYNLGVHT